MLDKRKSEEIDISSEPVNRLNAGPPSRPPFIQPVKEGGTARRWWGGLTKQSKLGVLMAAIALVLVLLVSWIASTATGDRSSEVVPVTDETAVMPIATSAHFTESVYYLSLSALAFRLDQVAGNASLTTTELIAEMPYLSRSTGSNDYRSRTLPGSPNLPAGAGRASGMGEPRETDGEDTVNGDAELIRKGNRLADRYIPIYQAYLEEIRVTREIVDGVWPSNEFKASCDLLLKSCDTLSWAMSESVNGLSLLRETNLDKARQADQAIQASSRLLHQGIEYLDQSVALLPLP